MIHGAGSGVDRNARDGAPGLAVGRTAHDDIVLSAACAEAAIGPDNEHFSGAVDADRWQIWIAQARGLKMAVDICDEFALAPTLATVGRTEYVDAATFKRHDDRAIRLHDGLAAQTADVIG